MNWTFELLDPAYGGVAEGPVWQDGNLLFTHIQASRIMCFDPASKTVRVWRENTNCANGLCLDLEGNLLACQGGEHPQARAVVRYGTDGSFTVLADQFQGKRFNIPNDLVVDPYGRIWFSDPFYEGAAGPWSKDRSLMELDHESVYRLDPQLDGSYRVSRVTFDTTRPNGLVFSLDFQTLYVAQSGRNPDEQRQLRAYPVQPDGSLGPYRLLHDFGPHRGIDGMRLDVEGNIIATAGWEHGGPGPSIYVFSPSGEILERHPVPTRRPTNCCFGGEDLTQLYVTTIDGELFRASTNRQGRPLPPQPWLSHPQQLMPPGH
ncbi:MAG: SMP-30/gluconolactonase/LRE family protein [Bryobacteraceae bacterium]|nr:SMP-30/gluconolactonase/LRE family protein [Bryobacteraceae bacterium]MDW8378136.1 SMP-30/gluconolactonase/LRE family protein [Bryobacterales bacterium]